MAGTLQLTDGTTTLNLIDGTNYAPLADGWLPQIARLRPGELGISPYTDVEETISLIIRGATAAALYANVNALAALLEQAQRWSRGDRVAAVRLRYQPQGSVNTLEVVVIGGKGPEGIDFRSAYDDGGATLAIKADLTLTRKGAWLGASESASSAAATLASVQTVTFTGTPKAASPTKISIAASAPLATHSTILVLWASTAGQLKIYEAESALPANVTSVADSANNARGGFVARYTPVNLLESLFVDVVAQANGRCCAVWAALRNNSPTVSWLVRAGGGEGPPILIDTSSAQPRLVPLGIVSNNFGRITAMPSALGGTLDCDFIVLHAMEDVTSGAVRFSTNLGSTAVINPQALSSPGGVVDNGDYDGNAVPYSRDTGIAVATFATAGARWRAVTSAAAVPNITITAQRNPAFLAPQ